MARHTSKILVAIYLVVIFAPGISNGKCELPACAATQNQSSGLACGKFEVESSECFSRFYRQSSDAVDDGGSAWNAASCPEFRVNSRVTGAYPVHCAAYCGNGQALQAILRCQNMVGLMDKNNFTPLMYAVLGTRKSAVALLIEAGANVEESSDEQRNVLQYAVMGGDYEIVSAIIQSLGRINWSQEQYSQVIRILPEIGEQDPRVIRTLVNFGANLRLTWETSDLMQEAFLYRNYKFVRQLIENGFPPNGVRNTFQPLVAAALARQYELMEFLIQRGADLCPNSSHISDSIADAIVIGMGNSATPPEVERASKLLDVICSSSTCRTQCTPRTLCRAAMDSSIPFIHLLVKRGVGLNFRNKLDGSTALQCAARVRATPSVAELLALGAEPQMQDDYGRTAFHEAVVGDSIAALQILVNSRQGINLGDREGRTALIYSAMGNKREALEVLLAGGARTDIRDNRGRSVWDYARTCGGDDVVQLLQVTLSSQRSTVSTVTQDECVIPIVDRPGWPKRFIKSWESEPSIFDGLDGVVDIRQHPSWPPIDRCGRNSTATPTAIPATPTKPGE